MSKTFKKILVEVFNNLGDKQRQKITDSREKIERFLEQFPMKNSSVFLIDAEVYLSHIERKDLETMEKCLIALPPMIKKLKSEFIKSFPEYTAEKFSDFMIPIFMDAYFRCGINRNIEEELMKILIDLEEKEDFSYTDYNIDERIGFVIVETILPLFELLWSLEEARDISEKRKIFNAYKKDF